MKEYTGKKISTFKERFSELCNSKLQGTTELAHELRVSRQTINAWKIGTRSPKDLTVKSIADYFTVSIEWLMGYDVHKYNIPPMNLSLAGEKPPDETPKTEEARILAKGIDKLDPEQRAQALAVVKAMFAQHPEIFKD